MVARNCQYVDPIAKDNEIGPQMSLSKPLTSQELAIFYTVSINTVYFWVSRPAFPRIKVGRHLRFDLDKVQRYFDEQTISNDTTCQTPRIPVRPKPPKRSLKTRDASRVDLQKKE